MAFNIFKKITAPAGQGSVTLPVTTQPATTAQPAAGTGRINLSKGQGISLAKTPAVTARCTWPPQTDYDVFALVLYRDGHVEEVATFGTDKNRRPQSTTQDKAVRHLGDVGRSADAQASESLQVDLVPDILAVVPVVYSAQSNGTGSFRKYKVGMEITTREGQSVVVDAANADANDKVYSCVPGVILNGPDGVRVEAVELYSKPGSEDRPTVRKSTDEGAEAVTVTMDSGARNLYK